MSRAFTIVEMMATVALAAIMAVVAAVSFAGVNRAARSADVADQVAKYDRQAREWSRRFGRPGQLTFDLDGGAIARGPAEESNRDDAAPAQLHLSGGFHLTRVVTAAASSTAGRVPLPCSTRGQTPSYAVEISGPDGEVRWLVIAGLTGHVGQARDEGEVQDMFKAMAGGTSDDAH